MLGALLVLNACASGPDMSQKLYEVKAETLVLSVKDTGELGSSLENTVYIPFDGTLVQMLEEGSVVKQGQEMGHLETSTQKEQRDAATLSLQEARLDLELVALNEKMREQQLKHDLGNADLSLKLEQIRLRRLKEYRDPVTTVRLKASAKALEQRMQILELEARERSRLYDLGYLSLQERDQARLQLEEARKEQERLQAEKLVFDQGPRAEDVKKQVLKVEKAASLQNMLKKESTVQQELSRVKSKGAQARIKKYQESFTYYDNMVKSGRLLASIVGTVIYGKVRVGQDEITVKAGDAVQEGVAVMRVVDLKKPLVRLTVHEIDAPRIELGQQAKIQLDAYPDLALTGRVSRLLPVARQTLENDELELHSVACEVVLDQADERLRPGMTANVEIITASLDKALTVPSEALVERNGEVYCWVLVNGKAQKRALSIGVSNARSTQVLSGLEPGDKVILNGDGQAL